MEKLLITLACAAGLGYQAGAGPTELMIGDPYYVGYIEDGLPGSLAYEAGFVNMLIRLNPGDLAVTRAPQTGETYDRVDSVLAGPFSEAVLADAVKRKPGLDSIDATGFTYILGEYAAGNAGSLVWVNDGSLGEVSLPSHFATDPDKYGLSNQSLYKSDSPLSLVPDAGPTLALMATGLFGLGLLARRRIVNR